MTRGWMCAFADLPGEAVGVRLGVDYYAGSMYTEVVEEWGCRVIGMR